eukprot:91260-Pyramimonas_sp.AAC.1
MGRKKHVDYRNAIFRRNYLKCVLAWADVHARGHASFQSNGSEAYYRPLLAAPGPIDPGLSAAACRDMSAQLKKNKRGAGDDE